MLKNVLSSSFRILITGPECSGKSTLSAALATHFAAPLVEEYAREFLTQLARPYIQQDLITICSGQMELEDKLSKKATSILICDTGPEVIKIWSEVKYKNCPSEIQIEFEKREYDLVFLCAPEFPWVDDPLREHPEGREALFGLYEMLLAKRHTRVAVLIGSKEERKSLAISGINHLIQPN
ncbi:MAG: ATP-binding protein [Flavobacteriales bacterium]|nr:ATP-binding protein [Flavobacteriales bacterium]